MRARKANSNPARFTTRAHPQRNQSTKIAKRVKGRCPLRVQGSALVAEGTPKEDDSMNIDSIHSGIVLDHIKAGRGMDVYRLLKLNELDCPVAYIRNVRSGAIGKKDIIKIDSVIDVDLDVLGYIDPGITVNIIKEGKVAEKKKLSLPEHLINVITCKNPRCITSVEGALDQHFILKDREHGVYRCMFCDAERKSKALR